MIWRRLVLIWALALAGAAGAAPLARAPVPQPRPAVPPEAASAQLIARAGLSGRVGYVLADARTGEVIESHNPGLLLPPASTIKALTALYALDSLGAGFRFRTRLLATGPVTGGRLAGDLILAGGGDPTLDSGDLARMMRDLTAGGLKEISGRFLYFPRALPAIEAIDPRQPAHVAYNPAVGGLNLNFNRVHFQWRRSGDGWKVTMDAPAAGHRPQVSVARMRVVDRRGPVYTYADKGGRDDWTVARGALGQGGNRWLPVRKPGLYTAEAFRALAADGGLALPPPRPGRIPPSTRVLAEHVSAPLSDILRGMLKHSTNLTAEVVGLTASAARARPPVTSLPGSAARMQRWSARRLGVDGLRLADHSGLGDGARVSPLKVVRVLARPGVEGPLRPLLPERRLRDARGRPLSLPGIELRAKTGTLNFVKGLAGYIDAREGRDLVFAIYMADMERRAAMADPRRERPPGGRAWLGRAVRLQRALLRGWVGAHAGQGASSG